MVQVIQIFTGYRTIIPLGISRGEAGSSIEWIYGRLFPCLRSLALTVSDILKLYMFNLENVSAIFAMTPFDSKWQSINVSHICLR